jgi:UDP-N-acetylglucosamine--N-acetylmuramyl-(pentapeptide) pyrophosphoryl-undecaprenol N-acetylglucosamine transferase
VAAGGTAGHVVPAMAVADELRRSGAEVSFLGTRERAEAELVPAAGYEIDFLDVHGLDRSNPLRAARALGESVRAVGTVRSVLRRRGVDVVLGGGGYVAAPAGMAAALTRRPLVLTEADSHLGLTNRMLAGRARRVCLAFPIEGRSGERYLVTGRPVPDAVLGADRAKARERFGVGPEERLLLVVSGSLGARSVNFAAVEAFAEREGRDFRVLHLAGHRDYADLRARLDAAPYKGGYELIDYEPNLGDSLAACDLVLGRSGGSIFEFTAAGRPAVLVPYPHATADHQTANARWMEKGGAATVVADDALEPGALLAEVRGVLGDPERLAEMSAASLALAKPRAARTIADQVLQAAAA